MYSPSTAEESKHTSDPSTVNKKALHSLELLGNPKPVIQCYISKDLNSQCQKLLYQGKQVQM